MECPRCGKPMGNETALSRVEDINICPVCGIEEAVRDFQHKPSLSRDLWHDKAPYIAQYYRIDRSALMPMEDVVAFLKDEGESYSAICALRERYEKLSGIDPIWRFPLSGENFAGGFVVPVFEGALWVPYDAIDAEDGESLSLTHATLLDVDACVFFEADLRTYCDEFCRVMQLLQGMIQCGHQ